MGGSLRWNRWMNWGKVAVLCGTVCKLQKQQPERAVRYYQAAFSLGAKLYQERLVKDELVAGLGLMSQAAAGMMQLAKENPDAAGAQKLDAEKLSEFLAATAGYTTQRITPVDRVVTSIDQEVLERHAGDVFQMAKHCDERLWQIEAILKVGAISLQRGARGRSAGGQSDGEGVGPE